jgi:hypothetical protein
MKPFHLCSARPKPCLGELSTKGLQRAEFKSALGSKLIGQKLTFQGYRFWFVHADGSGFLFESRGWDNVAHGILPVCKQMDDWDRVTYRFLATEPDILLEHIRKGQFTVDIDPGLITIHFAFVPSVWGHDAVDVHLRRVSEPTTPTEGFAQGVW